MCDRWRIILLIFNRTDVQKNVSKLYVFVFVTYETGTCT